MKILVGSGYSSYNLIFGSTGLGEAYILLHTTSVIIPLSIEAYLLYCYIEKLLGLYIPVSIALLTAYITSSTSRPNEHLSEISTNGTGLGFTFFIILITSSTGIRRITKQ